MIVGEIHIGIKPELGTQLITINMNMAQLTAIVGVEVESVRPNP
jgi:hypothetical protein